MSSRPLHIRDINDKTASWSIKVMVYEKSHLRQSASTPWRYQRITFADAKGDTITATIFGSDIKLFKDTFTVHSTYTISNAKVTRIADKYVKSGHPYQWTINRKTAYRFESDNIPCLDFNRQSVSLSTIDNFLGQKDPIDVVGIVIDQKEQRSFTVGEKKHTVKEYALISQEQRVVILTLWNDVAESEGAIIDECKASLPVISATCLIVSPYHGVSLGSTTSTVIVVDPNIPDAENLKSWRQNHIKLIAETLALKDHFAHVDDSTTVTTTNISSIAQTIADKKITKTVVRVSAKITDAAQKSFYMGCTKCHSAIDADYNCNYTCSSCKEDTHATPREKIVLNISDHSGNLDVTAFGTQAIYILEQNSIACMEQYNEGFPLDVSIINKRLAGKLFLMTIKKKGRQFRDTFQFQYSVQTLQPDDSIEAEQLPLSITNEYSTPTQSSTTKSPVHENNAEDALSPA